MRIHTYVIAVDSGAAPNYDAPCTTLAVCKPRIRRAAEPGELVLAFAGHKLNPHEPHTVVWAGVVSEKLSFADYWNDKRFAGKKPDRNATPDNFYRPTPEGGLRWVDNPVHFPEQAEHDINGQFVLAFKPAWRFGANGPPLPDSFGLRMVGGRRGERIHDLTDTEWRRLKTWLDMSARASSDDDVPAPCVPARRCTAPKRRPTRKPSHC